MKMKNEKTTLAIDLDGVVCQHFGVWRGVQHFGPVYPEAIQALARLKEQGYKIIIHTTRTNPFLNKGYAVVQLVTFVRIWLEKNKVPYDEIWCKPGKPQARFYIDDSGIFFKSWDFVEELLAQRREKTLKGTSQ